MTEYSVERLMWSNSLVQPFILHCYLITVSCCLGIATLNPSYTSIGPVRKYNNYLPSENKSKSVTMFGKGILEEN